MALRAVPISRSMALRAVPISFVFCDKIHGSGEPCYKYSQPRNVPATVPIEFGQHRSAKLRPAFPFNPTGKTLRRAVEGRRC